MDKVNRQLGKDDANLELDFSRIEVNAAFVHWRWCNERLRELVNSHQRYSGPAFSALFAVLRHESRLAELGWVSALYGFKWLKEMDDKAGVRIADGGERN